MSDQNEFFELERNSIRIYQKHSIGPSAMIRLGGSILPISPDAAILMAATKSGGEFIKLITDIIKSSKGFERHLEKVRITGGGDGKCTAEFTVSPEHLNRGGSLHGGFTATLVDMITTYALMSKPCHPGVSVNINVNYMKAAKEGDDIIIDANLLRAGKKLAFLECQLRHKKDNSIIAVGAHTKYVNFE